MSHDKDEFAGAGRLTRAIGVSLSADVELPPRPRLLGPLAETPDPVFSQITFPVADAPDADPQEERFVEAVEELGLGEALKALQRKAPDERLVELIEELGPDEALKALQRKAPGRKADATDRSLSGPVHQGAGGVRRKSQKCSEEIRTLHRAFSRLGAQEVHRDPPGGENKLRRIIIPLDSYRGGALVGDLVSKRQGHPRCPPRNPRRLPAS